MAIVYLHIGAPKTATSTLQFALAQNYRQLLKSGVLYPQDMMHANAHHALVCDLLEKHRGQSMPDIWYGNTPRGKAWDLLLSEIDRHESQIHSVVVSSELFFGQTQNLDTILRSVCDLLERHEIRVIVYLRRQDQLYSSFYNQDVKGIRQWSHGAYQFYQTHQIFEHGYHTVLKLWSNVFGRDNIIVRPFESAQWPESDVVKDFGVLIGHTSMRATEVQNNDSLGMVQLYVKQCLNKVGFDKRLNDEVLRILYAICPEQSANGCLYIHKSLYKKYREKWIEENRLVSDTYLAGQELFSHSIPSADDVTVYELDRVAVALYVRNMFTQFEQEHYKNHRKLFSKATLLVLAEQNLWNALDAASRITMLEWATSIEN